MSAHRCEQKDSTGNGAELLRINLMLGALLIAAALVVRADSIDEVCAQFPNPPMGCPTVGSSVDPLQGMALL